MYGLMTKLVATCSKRGRRSRQRRSPAPAAPRALPGLEALETRVVPSSGDWSMPNFSPAGTRDNTAETTLSPSNVSGLHVLWSFPTSGRVAGTPAVVGDSVFAGDDQGNFYAVSREGKLLWQTPVNGSVTGSALVVDDTVIFGTHDNTGKVAGTVYGLDAQTGKVRWQTQPQPNDLESEIWGSATLVGHNVAIGVATGDEITSPQPTNPTSRGSLVLLNPHNGDIIWQTFTVSDADHANGATGAAIWSTPAYDPALGLIYAGTGNNYTTPATNTSDAMMAFNAKTGAIVWVNQRTPNDTWDGRINPTGGPDADFGDSPHLYTLPGGETVVGSGDKAGFFWVFDAKSGAIVNTKPNGKQGLQIAPGSTLGGLFATAAVDPKTDVVFANARVPTNDSQAFPATGALAAISGNGLNVLWQVNTPSANQSGVALANGVVYFNSTNGTLYALDEATGALLAEVTTGGFESGPAVSDGMIFSGQGNFLGAGTTKGIVALGLSPVQHGQAPFLQTNLVSDLPGKAEVTDPNLVNPWGVSESATSPFWVSDQGASVATLYGVPSATFTGATTVPLVVQIPKTAAGPQGPTGQVHNFDTSAFKLANGNAAAFIFASLNGTISAWNGGAAATIEATTSGHVYTGLATNSTAANPTPANPMLYAANDAGTGSIDAFDASFKPVNLGTSAFVDPNLPAGLVPFGIQNVGGNLYVTYAPAGRAAQVAAQPGQGAVAIFDTSGKFIKQLIAGSQLASPWGITMSPASFGEFGGDLLVGNFAYNDSVINAFNPTTGKYLGTLTGPDGRPIFNQALWSLAFGNGGNGGNPNTLYFTAGIDMETHGLFGAIEPIPSLSPKAPVVPNLPDGARQTFSTVPTTGADKGDQNPYGVAFVPQGIAPGGVLQPGDLLVSDFNNAGTPGNPGGQKGTGSTIMRYTPQGGTSVFFQGTTGLGLTGALGVLKSGFVLVGSVPTDYSTTPPTVNPGSLLVLDSNGKVVETLSDNQLLDGPWFLALNDQGDRAQVFVSNVLSGTVTRIDLMIPKGGNPVVESLTQIASGYAHRPDPNALVVGPAGLAFDAAHDVLYVASTGDNAIFAIKNAAVTHHDHGMGRKVVSDPAHLHGPLGLVLAPNGDLIVSNGDAQSADPNQPNELDEFTTRGKFVGQFQLDKGAPGAAFGIAVSDVNGQLRFAAADDNTNAVDVWTFQLTPHFHKHKGDDQGQDDDD